MMSAPDRVAVNMPGATGIQQHQHNAPSPATASSPVDNADGGNGGDISGGIPPVDQSSTANGFSSAWTIGSTDGNPMGNSGNLSNSMRHIYAKAAAGDSPSSERAADNLSSLSQNVPVGSSHKPSMLQRYPGDFRSTYEDRILHQPSSAVEAVLAASCEAMGFDIAEVWLRTGSKTHQLTNSHLRPTALEDSVRTELIDVYYGDRSSERTHRLSPALCKRAKEAMDVVWVTAHTEHGAEALKCSISDVRTAVAIPVCHDASRTNMTFIFFSIRRAMMRPAAVEFLVHMALAAAVASVNVLGEELKAPPPSPSPPPVLHYYDHQEFTPHHPVSQISRSEHTHTIPQFPKHQQLPAHTASGAPLNLKWAQLNNVEYLTDGGNNWIHTAVLNGRPVVVKTLKPECQDVAVAINEIELELDIHSKLDHANICSLVGAGTTSKGVRFIVLERLDGGTLTQMLGYDNRIRDRRRRFWRKKQFAFVEVMRFARCIADALNYCHSQAIPGNMCLHRDLKPDNIGFTLDGKVKLLDFGLARIVKNSDSDSNEVYHMSGQTGSLRYMAPEVAKSLPYNQKADVYSFGIILWELNAYKKPYEGMNKDEFYMRVVEGKERPPINKKWPEELVQLMQECWSFDARLRPSFHEIVERLDAMLSKEKGGSEKKKSKNRISSLIDRHSTWF